MKKDHADFTHLVPYQLYAFKVRTPTKVIESFMWAKDWNEGSRLLDEFCLLNPVTKVSLKHAVLIGPSGYADIAGQETPLVPFADWPAGSFDIPSKTLDFPELASLPVREILDRVATGKLSAKDALIAEQGRTERRSSLITRLTALAGRAA